MIFGGCRMGRKHMIAEGSFTSNVIIDEDGFKSVNIKGRCLRCHQMIEKIVKVPSGTPVTSKMLE